MKKTFLIFAVCSLLCAVGVGTADAATARANYFVRRNTAGEVVEVYPHAAICTVHAYNAGISPNNPPAGTDRDEVDKVVAMKANLVTREMKKQYDYLDATVKRFQIQLQKAVLVAQAEAAGAPAAGSSSGAGAISGMTSCSGKNRTETVICLRSNYSKLSNALAANRSSDRSFRDQMHADVMVITSMTPVSGWDVAVLTPLNSCAQGNISMNRQTAQDCLTKINGAIVAIDEHRATTTLGTQGMQGMQ